MPQLAVYGVACVTVETRSRIHVPMAAVMCSKLTMHGVSQSDLKCLQRTMKRGPKLYVSGIVLQSDCAVPMCGIKIGLHALVRENTFEHTKGVDICHQRNDLSVCNPPGPPLRFACARGMFLFGLT